jgi:DNA-binding MarR family transcriptional regulator
MAGTPKSHKSTPPPRATVDEVAELLGETVDRARSVYAEAYAKEGLTERQWLLLRHLRREDQPPFVGQLAEWLQTEAPTATAMADRLQARGLIERRPDGGDGRRRTIHLTAAGESALDRVDAVAMESTPCRNLTRGQLKQLRDLLHTMLAD